MPYRTYRIWLPLFLAVQSAVVFGLVRARDHVLGQLDSPQALGDWQKWKDDAALQDGQRGPVKRRPITASEPPALVLFRDRFPVVLFVSLLSSTLLFAFLAIAIRGMTSAPRRPIGADRDLPRRDPV
jgi:hypothetical protein